MRRLGVLSLVLIAGCGTAVVDHSKAESRINTGLTRLGVQVQSVKCPSNVKIAQGTTMYCNATLRSGEALSISATQIDDKGDVHFRSTAMIATAVENTIEARLKRLNVTATATCPRHIPIVAGNQYACTVRDATGHSIRVPVTIVNSTGTFKLGR